MREWELVLAPETDGPRYLAIAEAIREDIVRGRLRADQKLPGARSLAMQIGVHRNTVTAAYAELEQEGWIRTEPARGRFVQPVQRQRITTRAGIAERVPYRLGAAPPKLVQAVDAPYDLAGGMPDARLYPSDALGRAYRRVLGRHGKHWLSYGDPQGNPRLRASIAKLLAETRGLAVDADDVFITRGSQMALWLIGQTLLSPGDLVAVESFGYRPAWDALRAHGAELEPISVDGSGMNLTQLEALCEETPPRAIYLTPHHQYPTTVALSAPRRVALLALARRHRIAVIEDDYDHELHYEGRPILPMATLDTGGNVLYIGTLSKVLAPGIRVGWVVAPAPVLDRLVRWRLMVDRQGDLAVEAAIAELMEEGELQRHVFRMRKIYASRRNALLAEVERQLPIVSLTPPRGGMSLWGNARGVDVETWKANAATLGVRIRTARDFAFDGRPRAQLRLGFARLDEAQLAEAVRRLAKALP
ncbi:MAG: PLP-dependent aminotransferase family protein [Myxococcota bacterium]